MFSNRLDFLMDLADVQNNALARAVSLDASYVSRLRSGQRPLPAKQSYVIPMARFLAHRIRLPHQREAARKALRVAVGQAATASCRERGHIARPARHGTPRSAAQSPPAGSCARAVAPESFSRRAIVTCCFLLWHRGQTASSASPFLLRELL